MPTAPNPPTLATDLLAVFTTVGDADTAHRIADALVTERLAACVQIEAITSVYRWAGAVQRDPEQRLMIKTTRERWPALRDRLLALHPYDLPALHALAVADAHALYAQWVAEETRPAD
jgi:periplasmic divalent cation tolerance protein